MNTLKKLLAKLRYRRQLKKEQRKIQEAIMRVAAGSIERVDSSVGRRFWQ